MAWASRLVGVVGELHAARLAPAADLHLGLDDHPAAEAVGDLAGLLHGGGDAAVQHRQPVPGEQRAPLVLVQVHCYRSRSVVLPPAAIATAAHRPQPSEPVTARAPARVRGAPDSARTAVATDRVKCPQPARNRRAGAVVESGAGPLSGPAPKTADALSVEGWRRGIAHRGAGRVRGASGPSLFAAISSASAVHGRSLSDRGRHVAPAPSPRWTAWSRPA